MTEIQWTDAELNALAVYRHAETHEDAREAEEDLRALVAARVQEGSPCVTTQDGRVHADVRLLPTALDVTVPMPDAAFTITTAHGVETHHRDTYGQIGHHRAGPDCTCGPEIEETT